MTTVTLLHAVTRDRHDFAAFAPMVDRLNPRPVDLLGHGDAPRAPRYRLEDFASAVAWPDGADEDALLYGHSLGGMVALAIAQNHPGRARGIVLEDPPLFESRQPRLDTTPWAAGFRGVKRIITGKGRDWDLADWERAVAEWPSGHGDQTIAQSGGPEAARRRARQIASLDPAVLDAMAAPELLEGFDPVTAIRAAGCPVTILAGARAAGSALSEDDLGILAREPAVTLVRIQAAGHYLHEARPDICASALKVLAPD